MHCKITYLENRNPWTDRYKILHAGCRPGRNHPCQFWWRSVKGFWCDEGSNFGLFHWLALSPLKHPRTTVRVSDTVQFWGELWDIIAVSGFLRHVRRVEPVHFGCVELIEQHSSTRSTRRTRLARHDDLDRRDLQLSYDHRNSFIV